MGVFLILFGHVSLAPRTVCSVSRHTDCFVSGISDSRLDHAHQDMQSKITMGQRRRSKGLSGESQDKLDLSCSPLPPSLPPSLRN